MAWPGTPFARGSEAFRAGGVWWIQKNNHGWWTALLLFARVGKLCWLRVSPGDTRVLPYLSLEWSSWPGMLASTRMLSFDICSVHPCLPLFLFCLPHLVHPFFFLWISQCNFLSEVSIKDYLLKCWVRSFIYIYIYNLLPTSSGFEEHWVNCIF